ncbi:8468_t:CDS:1, partial [Gigaspora rosea]
TSNPTLKILFTNHQAIPMQISPTNKNTSEQNSKKRQMLLAK